MKKSRKEAIAQNEISVLEEFVLGGFKQKVLIEGKTANLPLLLFLHGGPGSAFPFSVGCRGLFPGYTNQFIMVYWDQLGCGINNHAIDESFTIEMFVAMTVDLIWALKNKFPQNKLYLFAASWGSILAARAIGAVPRLVNGAAVYGQVVKELFFNREVFQAVESSAAPAGVKRQAAAFRQKSSITIKNLRLVATWVKKYTNGYQNKKEKGMPLGSILWGLFTSPDYRLRDFAALFINGYRANKSLLLQMISIDLSADIKNMPLPYYVVQGSSDIVTSTKTVSGLIQESGNPNLHCTVVENSGHLPSQKCMDLLEKQLLAMAGR